MQLIHFGNVPPGYDTEGTFAKGGAHYYYQLQIRDDEVVIADSVGRYVPMCKESAEQLLEVLGIVVDLANYSADLGQEFATEVDYASSHLRYALGAHVE